MVKSADDELLERLLRVRGPLLERAKVALGDHATRGAAVMPAWQRYEGVVWTHLDPATLTPAQRSRLLIPSALYGVNAGHDEITDYRLTVKVALAPLGGLANYWRPHLTATLLATAGTFVSLLPREHESAIDVEALSEAGRFRRVRFTTADGQGAAGHDAKAVKGHVARSILRRGLGALPGWTWEGWTALPDGHDWTVMAPPPPRRPRK